MTLSGNAEVAELTVAESAPVVDKTLAETKQEYFLGEETSVITIERDGTIISPRGGTTLKPGDIVTLLSPEGLSPNVLEMFGTPEKKATSQLIGDTYPDFASTQPCSLVVSLGKSRFSICISAVGCMHSVLRIAGEIECRQEARGNHLVDDGQ